MANNLGFLAQEQKGFFDPNLRPTLVPPEGAFVDAAQSPPQIMNIRDQLEIPDLLSRKLDRANEIYNNTAALAARLPTAFGKYRLSLAENQKNRVQQEYDDLVSNQLQSFVTQQLRGVQSYDQALQMFGGTDIDDWNNFVAPELARLNIKAPTESQAKPAAPNAYMFVRGEERKRGYSVIEGGVPRYYFEDGTPVSEDWQPRNLTSEPKVVAGADSTRKVPTEFQDIDFLIQQRKKLNQLTPGTPEYEAFAGELAQYEDEYKTARWGNAQAARSKWTQTVAEFSYTSDLISRMFEQLNNPKVTTGYLASTLNLFEGISSQVMQGFDLGKEVKDGQEVPKGTLNAADLYSWNDAAEVSGAFKANVTDLAYALARMAEPGGRLSTPDVQNQIRRIAPQGELSKSGIAAALLEIDQSLQNRIGSQHAALLQGRYPVEDFKFPRGPLKEGSVTEEGVTYNALVYETSQTVKNSEGKDEPLVAVVMRWLPEGDQ